MSVDRVVIVGGGILGTMHALEATNRGWEVLQLEADAGPRRASVRNFGLIWVSGRAGGEELDLAMRARTLWERIASTCPGIGFRPDGSLTVARTDTELSLMAEAASRSDASARRTELLDPSGVRDVNPAVKGEVAGGLLCRLDAVVEPGSVLGAVRKALETTGRYQWLPGRRAVDVRSAGGPAPGTAGPAVTDNSGAHHQGAFILLCVGDRLSGFGGRVGAALAEAPLRRCQLQMMQTAPLAERLSTALADGDSMRYYPAYDLPGRSSLPPLGPEASKWGMQLLVVQRAAGGLTIGDTHVYDEPFDFAVDEQAYDQLRSRVEAILGWELPPVVRRWAGTYALVTDDRIYFRGEMDDRVWAVTGAAGRGLTLSPAIAEQTWDEVTM
jgi:FAD dependent oxidoreductase TIGR03364